jgi:hypothetical protein
LEIKELYILFARSISPAKFMIKIF